MTFMKMNETQANALRGMYGAYNALEPVPLEGTSDYILTDHVMSEPAFSDVLGTLETLPAYPQWAVGIAVSVGGVYEYEGRLRRCVQAHTTQSDWTPDVTPALWVNAHDPATGPQPWVQPQGSHDAYKIGDRVTHNGKLWECTVDANVWEPSVFGWVEVIS